MCNITIPAHL